MTDWPVKTLGDVATIATGKIDVNAATENGEYPFFTCSRDVYRIDDAPFEGKAILVAGNGDLNVKYYEGRFNAYQRTYFLFARDENKCYPRYLFWFLENYLDVLRSGASGSTIKYIRLGDLSEASIAVPPLEEQKRIVALLDTATERVTELTACYEQARTHANNLFASALRDALESNPDWPVKTLGDISEIAYGYTESAKNEEVGPKFLRITDIKDRGVNWDEVPFCPIDTEQLKRHRLEDGDIVFARTGATTGKSFLVIDPPLAVCASYLIRLRIDKKMVSPDFLNLNFQTTGYWKQVNDGMSGAAQGGFNATKLGLLEIPVPSLAEQKKIVVQLDSMRAKTSEMVAAYDAKLTAAKNLRQSILEAAFAGDL
jgi:type I restriction enzyme S subunit